MSIANALEQQMLDLINDERAQAGLNPLMFNSDLNESSEDHSQWMIADNTFSHSGENGSTATQRMADAGYAFSGSWQSGENIAYQSVRGEPGLADDIVDLHNGLMNSPSHRANILNPNFEEIGIGIEPGEFTARGTDFDSVFVTQNFATSDADQGPEEPGTTPQSAAVPEPMAELDTPDEEPQAAAPVPEPVTEPLEEPSLANADTQNGFDAWLENLLKQINSPDAGPVNGQGNGMGNGPGANRPDFWDDFAFTRPVEQEQDAGNGWTPWVSRMSRDDDAESSLPMVENRQPDTGAEPMTCWYDMA